MQKIRGSIFFASSASQPASLPVRHSCLSNVSWKKKEKKSWAEMQTAAANEIRKLSLIFFFKTTHQGK